MVCEAADDLGLSAVTQNSLEIWSQISSARGLRWRQWAEELLQSGEREAHGHLSPLFQRGWQVRALSWFPAYGGLDFSPRTKTTGWASSRSQRGQGRNHPAQRPVNMSSAKHTGGTSSKMVRGQRKARALSEEQITKGERVSFLSLPRKSAVRETAHRALHPRVSSA